MPGTSAAPGEQPAWRSRLRAAGPDRHGTTLTPVSGHYGSARRVLVAGSTSTGRWKSLHPGRAPPEKMAGGARCQRRQQPGDWRVRALAAAPAACPHGRWQGKVSPCRTLPGAAPWTHGSIPECATSHRWTHSTRTHRPDRRNQNMAPVHTARPGTAGHTPPVHTWCQYTQPGTQRLYTQPGLPQPPHGTSRADRPRGHSAPIYAIGLPSDMSGSARTHWHSPVPSAVRRQGRPPHAQPRC